MNKIKNVIITGVTGQDGSYMADFLLENTDYNIYGLIRRASTNNHRNIKHLLNNPRFKLVTGDLTDSQSIDNIVREVNPDYFINLAAQSFVGASWQIPEQTFDIDAVGVIRCLEAIRKHAPNCRFYNAGSSEEFGNVDYSPQDEMHPLKPRSPYGAAKAAARHIVKVYREI
jgi:GDPmannose 4,6-dehydratase